MGVLAPERRFEPARWLTWDELWSDPEAALHVNVSETRRPSENTEQGVPRPHHAEDTDPSQAAA